MQIVKESPNLLRLTRFRMFNCFLVREDDGCTLIDTNVGGSASFICAPRRAAGPFGESS